MLYQLLLQHTNQLVIMPKGTTLIALGLLFAPLSVAAQTSSACDRLIADVRSDIIHRLRMPLYSVNFSPVDNPSNPHIHRVMEVVFLLNHYTRTDEHRAAALMSSPKLLASYAKRITDVCKNVATVSFGYHATSYAITFFRMTDGTVRLGECVPLSRKEKIIPWGYIMYVDVCR
ncbi:hypothetical protein RYO59_000023 [Thermosynechococcaceae cyanobacterium Okahandja]